MGKRIALLWLIISLCQPVFSKETKADKDLIAKKSRIDPAIESASDTGFFYIKSIGNNDTRLKQTGPMSFAIKLSGAGEMLNKNWRVKLGDNPDYAKPTYPDNDWLLYRSFDSWTDDGVPEQDSLDKVKANPRLNKLFEQKRIAWFRLHVRVDSSLLHENIALVIHQEGAADVFWDGKKRVSFGQVSENSSKEIRYNPHLSPIIINLNGKTDHLLAIRYSNHGDDPEGFSARVEKMEDALESVKTVQNLLVGFPLALVGFFTALAIVHLLIYLFNREKSFNLFYSIFIGTFGFVFLLLPLTILISNPDTSSKINYATALLMPLYLVSFSILLYLLFHEKKRKMFWITIGVGALDLILNIFAPQAGFNGFLKFFLAVFVYVDSFRVSMRAIRRNLEGAKIVAFGVLGSTLFFLLGFFWMIIGMGLIGDYGQSFISTVFIVFLVFMFLSILSIPLSVSTYLALEFSRTNKSLSQKLTEVQELSEITVRQEQEKQRLLESRQEELENTVAERTREIVQQNELILLRNKEVSDSLLYASRIQNAILPSLDILKGCFSEYGIFYRPKAVVSGDFYFLFKQDEYLVVAVGDCTGHGVPGALMSMIGSTLLQQSVESITSLEPGEILRQLNLRVMETLGQRSDASSTQDGMDIALCVVNQQTKELSFAGAMRPLYVLQPDPEAQSANLLELKPDKRSVGGGMTLGDYRFVSQKIQLNPGDCIYLFTDGYADQFGGEKGKKFMLKNFKTLLINQFDLSMKQQALALEASFESWKGEEEQVDDVLVVGLRV